MAFARYYWEQVGEATVSGDPSVIERLSLPKCAECGAVPRAVRERKAKGQHAAKSSVQVKVVGVREGSGDDYSVNVGGNELSVNMVDSAGEVVETTQPGVFTWTTRLHWTGQQWRVTGFESAA
jgi:hypothetical protein